MSAARSIVALLTLLSSVTLGRAAFAHGGHLSDEAWRTCDTHQLGDACTFAGPTHEEMRGTCRSMSGGLVCVRNQPIGASRAMGSPTQEPERHVNPVLVVLALAIGIAAWGVVGREHFARAAKR